MEQFRILISAAMICAVVPGVIPQQAVAQQSEGQGAIAGLPLALRAAVLDGNSDAINQAIATLAPQPQAAAMLAQKVIAAAAQLLQNNSTAAVAAAVAAVKAVSALPVSQDQPAVAAAVAAKAARILVQPGVAKADPFGVGQLSIAVTQLISIPSVYQVAPQTAIQVMANAYAAAGNPAVAAATPNVLTTVTQLLNSASQANDLTQANPTNAVQISDILTNKILPSLTIDIQIGGIRPQTNLPSVNSVTAPPAFTVSPT